MTVFFPIVGRLSSTLLIFAMYIRVSHQFLSSALSTKYISSPIRRLSSSLTKTKSFSKGVESHADWQSVSTFWMKVVNGQSDAATLPQYLHGTDLYGFTNISQLHDSFLRGEAHSKNSRYHNGKSTYACKPPTLCNLYALLMLFLHFDV